MAQWIVSLWNAIIACVLKQILEFDIMSWGGGSADGAGGAWTLASSIHDALLGFGSGLAVVFWAISFFRYIDSFHKIDFREAAGWILRFAVILVIMNETMLIMRLFLDLASEINQSMLNVGYSNMDLKMEVPPELLNAVESVNTNGNIIEVLTAFFESIPISLFYFLLLGIILCCGVVIMVVLFMRYFKLYIYTALAPIPLSTLAGSTSTEVGKHFLKAWASVCLEICVITAAVLIFMASIAGGTQADILPFLGNADGTGGASDLWSLSLNWGLSVLVKSVLLVSVIKGSDRIMEKIIGT